jgi:ABC-type spermidine/putrescine transport system permease subunit II
MLLKPRSPRWDRNPIWLYIVCALVLFFLIVPILIIIPMSFGGSPFLEFPPRSFSLQWYQKFFTDPNWLRGAWNSIRVAISTTIISCLFGIAAAIGITSKAMQKRGGGLFSIILLIPMILPSIIVAIAMYMIYGQWKLVGTFPGLIIAHTVLAIPMVVILVSASLYGVDINLYNAARSLGANHLTALMKIVLPLIKPAIFTSMLFAFITSFDESVVTMFIAKQYTATLPKMIFNSLKYEVSPAVSAISAILIYITLILFILRGIASSKKVNTSETTE